MLLPVYVQNSCSGLGIHFFTNCMVVNDFVQSFHLHFLIMDFKPMHLFDSGSAFTNNTP